MSGCKYPGDGAMDNGPRGELSGGIAQGTIVLQ